MSKPESNTTDLLTKVHPITICREPLKDLIDICGSIQPPSRENLKSMLNSYKVVNGTLWYSIFVQDWPDFYNLPTLLESMIETYAVEQPCFSQSCSELLYDINNCQESIETFTASKPERPNKESANINELFDNQAVSQFHKCLTRICRELHQKYLPEFSKAYHALNTKDSAEPLLSDRQLEIWELLKDQSLTAKEIGRKLELSGESIRQYIKAIREKRGQKAIENTRNRGYWRPDAPPPDSMNKA